MQNCATCQAVIVDDHRVYVERLVQAGDVRVVQSDANGEPMCRECWEKTKEPD